MFQIVSAYRVGTDINGIRGNFSLEWLFLWSAISDIIMFRLLVNSQITSAVHVYNSPVVQQLSFAFHTDPLYKYVAILEVPGIVVVSLCVALAIGASFYCYQKRLRSQLSTFVYQYILLELLLKCIFGILYRFLHVYYKYTYIHTLMFCRHMVQTLMNLI